MKYATIGLLFVNISVGGTLTHFAAPPVLLEDELDIILADINNEVDALNTCNLKIDETIEKARARLFEPFMASAAARGIDPELARKAFDQRFSEVKQHRLRRIRIRFFLIP